MRFLAIPLDVTRLVFIYIDEESEKYWGDSPISKFGEKCRPADQVKSLGAIHCTSIYSPSPALVVINGGSQGPGTHGSASHALEAELQFINT